MNISCRSKVKYTIYHPGFYDDDDEVRVEENAGYG